MKQDYKADLSLLKVQVRQALKKKKLPAEDRKQLNAKLLRIGLAEIAIKREVNPQEAYEYVIGSRGSLS